MVHDHHWKVFPPFVQVQNRIDAERVLAELQKIEELDLQRHRSADVVENLRRCIVKIALLIGRLDQAEHIDPEAYIVYEIPNAFFGTLQMSTSHVEALHAGL